MATTRDYLGRKLKDLREQRGLTGRELARLINYSQAGVSKVERGLVRPSYKLVQLICEALHLPKAQQRRLLEDTKLFLDEFDKWTLDSLSSVSEAQRIIGQREARAKVCKHFAMSSVPGLLQTQAYMEAILNSLNVLSQKEILEAVQLRLARQELLFQVGRTFYFVLDERALIPAFCDPQTMLHQIEHIRSLVVRKNVSIRIIPLGARYAACPVTSFVIYDDALVSIESLNHELNIWTESEVSEYVDVFSALASSALSADASSEFLKGSKGK